MNQKIHTNTFTQRYIVCTHEHANMHRPPCKHTQACMKTHSMHACTWMQARPHARLERHGRAQQWHGTTRQNMVRHDTTHVRAHAQTHMHTRLERKHARVHTQTDRVQICENKRKRQREREKERERKRESVMGCALFGWLSSRCDASDKQGGTFARTHLHTRPHSTCMRKHGLCIVWLVVIAL